MGDLPIKSPLRPPLVIPFGRVLTRNDGAPPVNEVMIGREAERAYFINLLVSRGPTGSYLITGRRGVGKTSFVRHCLNEYGEAVFKRFLRNNSGKSLWDYMVLSFVVMAFICASLLLTMLSLNCLKSISYESATITGTFITNTAPLLMISLPIILLCAILFIYAHRIVEICFRFKEPRGPSDPHVSLWEELSKIFRSPGRREIRTYFDTIFCSISHWGGVVAAALCATVAIATWLFLPAEPILALARFFVCLCLLYAIIQHHSYQKRDHQLGKRQWRRRTIGWFIFVIVMAMLLFFIDVILDTLAIWGCPYANVIHEFADSSKYLIAISFLCLWHGNAARAIFCCVPWRRTLVTHALRDSRVYYVLFAFVSLLGFVLTIIHNSKGHGLFDHWKEWFLLFSVSVFWLWRFRCHHVKAARQDDADRHHFRPYCRQLLILKACGAIIVALQLGHPALSAVQHRVMHELGISESTPWPLCKDNPASPPSTALACRNIYADDSSGIFNEFSVETSRDWAVLLFVILSIFFFIEYDWVVRPFINERGERSLEPGVRPPWDDQKMQDVKPHERFHLRELERMTFPRMAYSVWLPTLTVTVNLGFDKLDHRSVIHAMLVGLRTEYQRSFLSWRSDVGFILRFLGVVLTLCLVAQLGRSWFELPDYAIYKEDDPWGCQAKIVDDSHRKLCQERREEIFGKLVDHLKTNATAGGGAVEDETMKDFRKRWCSPDFMSVDGLRACEGRRRALDKVADILAEAKSHKDCYPGDATLAEACREKWDRAVLQAREAFYTRGTGCSVKVVGEDAVDQCMDNKERIFKEAIKTWMAIDAVQAEGIAVPPVAPRPLVVPNPESLVYKKHPEDIKDYYCKFYRHMRKFVMELAIGGDSGHAAPETAAAGHQTQPEAAMARDQAARLVNTIYADTAKFPNPAMSFICSFEESDLWVSLFYFPILEIKAPGGEREDAVPLNWFTHLNTPLPFEHPDRSFDLRAYHVLLFVFIGIFGHWAFYWFPLLAYRRNLQRIDDLLDSLSSRTVQRRNNWKPAQWLSLLFGEGGANEIEREPMESRAIELAVLEILRDLQDGTFGFIKGTVETFSVPAPEITFVFDELDKLGPKVDSEDPGGGANAEDATLMNAERQRSIALHRLMSDLKRLLSAAPARFVFVGGRQLHDEWLADQTSRHPLLTSIFNAEIYLPSLLTDHRLSHVLRDPDPPRLCLHDRLREYVALQHDRCFANMQAWTTSRFRPACGHDQRWEQTESFFQPGQKPAYREKIDELWSRLNVLNPFSPGGDGPPPPWARDFLRGFIHFLTYRSVGNPKRLRELLFGFLEPTGRVVPDHLRWSHQALSCLDMLYFDDDDIFRIQMIDTVYRHVVDRFGGQLVRRDDKIAVSLFFMSDFLFKFHRRAFAWSSLERIEELVHIHRAPDLRRMLEDLVEHGAGRFLHRVLNGMYAFRFRSEISCEIEYLSRRSEDDLAAFNFTLDESQALKRLYQTATRGEGGNAEALAGLGELFEFDEEYEAARQYYRQAIDLLDKELDRLDPGNGITIITQKERAEARSVFWEVLSGDREGKKIATVVMSWGLARLRLMLQIGLTYELSRNTERAEAEYRNAFALSERLFDAYLEGVTHGGLFPDYERRENPAHRLRAQNALKHQSLFYQPAFAIAWIAEKLMGNIDDSISIVENYLNDLRDRLPFVRDPFIPKPADDGRSVHSNFSLVMAELHRKAGDLYFFKGIQFISTRNLPKFTKLVINNESGKQYSFQDKWQAPGFLLRADYHYCICLHELQRLSQWRRLASTRLNTGALGAQTLHSDRQPGLINLAVGMALSDFSDSILSRASLFGLFRWLFGHDELTGVADGKFKRIDPGKAEKRTFDQAFDEWFDVDPRKDGERARRAGKTEAQLEEALMDIGPDILEPINSKYYMNLNDIGSWVGRWTGETGDHKSCPIQTRIRHNSHERLLMALRIASTSASYFQEGGYLDEAAQTFMKICETVCTVFWWIAGVRRLTEWVRSMSGELPDDDDGLMEVFDLVGYRTSEPFKLRDVSEQYLLELEGVAREALEQGARAFEAALRGRDGADPTPRGYLRGGILPPSVLTAACSLYLSAEAALGDIRCQSNEVFSLIRTLAGDEIPPGETETDKVRAVLEHSLFRSRYPILNQLNVFNVLILSNLLVETDDGPAAQSRRLQVVDRYVREWLDLIDGYTGSLHFGPLFTGTALAWFCLAIKSSGVPISPGWLATDTAAGSAEPASQADGLQSRYWKYRRSARRHLERAQQLHTMGAAYYEVIANLNYLYDDFNDRHIHFCRALQMAGMELNSVLLSKPILHLLGREDAAAISEARSRELEEL